MGKKNKKGMDEQTARLALLASGTSIFARKGYAAGSVREIVELAGTTKPMLYYYFANKEGLFRSILEWGADIQEELLSKVILRGGTFPDRMNLLYRSTYQAVLENMNFFRLIHNLIFGAPQDAPKYDLDVYRTRMMEAIRTIYLEGIEKGEVRKEDPNDVAALLMGLMNYCFHTMFLNPRAEKPERFERLLRLAFQGLRSNEADQ